MTNVVLDLEPLLAAPDEARWSSLARARALAILVDLDGTLVPFAPTPEQAELDRAAVRMLEALKSSGAQVVIVSGRPQPLIERLRSRVVGAWWVAEHGAWRTDGGAWIEPPRSYVLDALAAEIAPLAVTPGARFERKSLSLCIHWRSVLDSERARLVDRAHAICGDWLDDQPDYEALDGAEVLEIRHRSANKGAAVAWVRERLPGARLLAIGDDLTDEDMFAALGPGDLAVAVGHPRGRPSRAHAHLAGPAAVRNFLRWVVDVRTQLAEDAPPIDSAPISVSHANARSLVVVSNRMPGPPIGERMREVGGLVAALEPALRDHDAVWLGWSGVDSDGEPRLTMHGDPRPTRASFDLSPTWRRHFYGGFCNRALWPLLHGFPSRVRYNDVDWNAYVDANEAYARFAGELVEPDGIVWVHDYHLLLVARALRRRGHRGPIGLFLHIPVPGRDAIETLPWRTELLAAMLEFDLVGFHTQQWADNFVASAGALASASVEGTCIRRDGDATTVGVFPIAVDSSFGQLERALSPDVTGLCQVLGDRRLILGVDRLDYAKGIPERLLAFEALLERHTDWRGRVSFVQISVPSREDVPEYADLRIEVEQLVGRINGRFGEADWVPVRYLYRSYDRDVLAQLYRAADVALVTPLRDGMNLVAKEFVASRPDEDGVLVLSRFTGAAEELREALIVNPHDVEGTARALAQALDMPLAERARRQAALLRRVESQTAARWAESFVRDLAGYE